MPASPLRPLLLATLAVPLAVVVACTESSPDGGAAPAAREAPPQTVTADPAPAVGTQAASGEAACEDFGDLSGTSLTANASGTTAAAAMTVANRPVPTRLAVSAYGPAKTLVGQTVALGAAENANLATCTHCLAIAIGCTATSCEGAAWFFPKDGTATFTKVGYGAGDTFEGTFHDVVLEQVKVDFATMISTPVPGAACVRLPSLAFSASVAGTGGGTSLGGDGGSASDAGTGLGVDSDAGSRGSGGGGGGVKNSLL